MTPPRDKIEVGARSLVREVCTRSFARSFGARSFARKVLVREVCREVLREVSAKFCKRGSAFYKIPPKLQRKLPGLLLRLVRKISPQISPSYASEFSRISGSFADFRRPGPFAVLL